MSSSCFIPYNMSTAQLWQARFPLSHWDQASSTLGIPQLTLTQQVIASVLYTVSHLRREQLSSLHHHESPFSNRKQLCTCRAWFAMCRNPSQHLKRQLPKSKCQLAAWRSSLWSHPTCTGSPTQLLQPLLKRLGGERLSLCVRKGCSQKRGQREGVWEKVQSKGGEKGAAQRNRSKRNKEQDDGTRQKTFFVLTSCPCCGHQSLPSSKHHNKRKWPQDTPGKFKIGY